MTLVATHAICLEDLKHNFKVVPKLFVLSGYAILNNLFNLKGPSSAITGMISN